MYSPSIHDTQYHVRNDVRDKPKLLGRGIRDIHTRFGVYVFNHWGQATCKVQFSLLKPGSLFQAYQFLVAQEFGFVRESGVVKGQFWSLHRRTLWCWKHLSSDLSKTLQRGTWSSEGIVLYSQVKLSSSYANLINCQGKESFVVTEVQQFNFASHFLIMPRPHKVLCNTDTKQLLPPKSLQPELPNQDV